MEQSGTNITNYNGISGFINTPNIINDNSHMYSPTKEGTYNDPYYGKVDWYKGIDINRINSNFSVLTGNNISVSAGQEPDERADEAPPTLKPLVQIKGFKLL